MLEVISYVLSTFFKTFLEIVSWFKPCRTECVEVFGHLVNVLEDECVVGQCLLCVAISDMVTLYMNTLLTDFY